ncbi:MAG: hypothetical protein IJC86_02120 [Clostridia bacterium]|nr:hypothetical protein [Clostridia bacterium]
MKKRVLSMFLTLVLMLTALPVAAVDTASAELGTEAEPYVITTLEELNGFLTDVSGKNKSTVWYSLGADIIATEETKDSLKCGSNLEDVILEGNGHKISGFTMTDALFAEVNDSSVRNIVFENITVNTESAHSAVLAGSLASYTAFVTGCTFINCKLTTNSNESSVYAGIVAAENIGSVVSCTVDSSCSVTADSTSAKVYMGGICGINEEYSYVVGCFAQSALTATDGTTLSSATVVGKNYGEVMGCLHKDGDTYYVDGVKNTDDVYVLAAKLSSLSLDYNAQGVEFDPPVESEDYAKLWTVDSSGSPAVAFDERTAQVILNMDTSFYNKSLIKSFSVSFSDDSRCRVMKKSAQGDVLQYSVSVGYYDGSTYVRNSAVLDAVCAVEYKRINSFVLSSNYGYITKYADNIFTPENDTYSTVFAFSKSDAEHNKSSLDIYPFEATLGLKSVKEADQIVDYTFSGSGTDNNPFLITNEHELRILSTYVNSVFSYKSDAGDMPYNKASYALANDIKMSSNAFTPIGVEVVTEDTAFRGTFDGRGYTISDLHIKSTIKGQGLFGDVMGIESEETPGQFESYAQIKNLNLLNVSIQDDTSQGAGTRAENKGAVAGRAQHAIINGCVTSGTIDGMTQIGGVVGYAYKSKIYNCGSTASIAAYSSNARAGGITGYAQHSEIVNGYSAVTISAKGTVDKNYLNLGYVAGHILDSTIENVFYLNRNQDAVTKVWAGAKEETEADLKSDSFVQSLNKYAADKRLGANWAKDTNSINSGYPFISEPAEVFYRVYTIATGAGYVTLDNYTYKSGEEVTLPGDEAVGYTATDMDMNPLNLRFTEDENGDFSFIMPSYDVRIIPDFGKETFAGLGTEEDPFVITNLRTYLQMDYLWSDSKDFCVMNFEDGYHEWKQYSECYYVLDADIDCKNMSMNPIGPDDDSNRFTGTFDGRGYKIYNCNVINSVFGNLYEATIRNLRFENITVSGTDNIAIVSAYADGVCSLVNISIENCSLSGAEKAAVMIACRDVVDLRMFNCRINDIQFSDCKDTAVGAVSYHYQGRVAAFANNCVITDVRGGVGKMVSCSEFIGEDYSNIYYDSALSLSDLKDDEGTPKSIEELNSEEFISGLSYYTETELEEFGACLWGENSENEIDLSIGGTPDAVSRIIIDSVFTEYQGESPVLKTDNVPYCAKTGQEITLKYKLNAALANLRISTRDGSVAFTVSSTKEDKEYGTISFIMPEGYVTIDNNGRIPTVQYLEGKGTESDPYQISYPYELTHFASVINGDTLQYKPESDYVDYETAYVELTTDIDMKGMPWEGIGTDRVSQIYSFKGTFDGNMHTISNLNTENGAEDGARQSLFQVIGNGATVRNLILKNANVWVTADSVGGCGAVARGNYGTIENCMVTDSSVSLGNWYGLGGITGINYESGVVSNCAVVNTIIQRRWGAAGAQTLGGITQDNRGKLINCYTYNCNFSNGTSANGGIASVNSGSVEKCYYNIAGVTTGVGTSISKETFRSGEIAYLFNNGVTDGTQVWYQNLDNDFTPDDYPLFIDNDENTVYKVDRDRVYSNKSFNKNPEGSFIIKNYWDLCVVAELVNSGDDEYQKGSYILANDIICPEGKIWYDPIGAGGNDFEGVFDGGGHSIKNLVGEWSEAYQAAGLFYRIDGATVKNLHVVNARICGTMNPTNSPSYVIGGITAVASDSTISGCSFDGYLKAEAAFSIEKQYRSSVGGICGSALWTTRVINCYSTGELAGSSASFGGLVHTLDSKAVVSDSYFDGKIVGYYNVGGICSYNNGTITNCYYNTDNTISAVGSGRGTQNSVEGKSGDQFRSGEVAYLLNKGVTDGTQVWYQSVDNEPLDVRPLFSGKTVYKQWWHNTYQNTPPTIADYFEAAKYNEETGMYEVEHAGNLFWMSALVNGDTTYAVFPEQDTDADFILMGDIDASNAPVPYIPIGDSYPNTYTGDFDGRGYTVRFNNSIVASDGTNMGMFGVVKGTIKNVNLTGELNITSDSNAYASTLAGVAGTMRGGSISNVKTTLAYNIAGLDQIANIGGIVGYTEGDSIALTRCISDDKYVFEDGFEIICYGGIVSSLGSEATIKYCASRTSHNIPVKLTAAGIVGYATQLADVRSCYSYGYVEDAADPIIVVADVAPTPVTEDNYYLDTIASGAGCAYGMPLSAEKFASGEATYLLNGGETATSYGWYQNITNDPKDIYPVLNPLQGQVHRREDGTYYNVFGANLGGTIGGTAGNKPATDVPSKDTESSLDKSDKHQNGAVQTGPRQTAVWIVSLMYFAVVMLFVKRRQSRAETRKG